MPNDSISTALKEVYALAPNVPTLETLEISYVGLTETLYLVQDRVSWTLTLEGTGGAKTFKPCGFRFTQPAAGKDGVQQLSLAIDNVGSEVSSFFNTLGTELTEPVKVTYRTYLSNDITQPQYVLSLFLVDITMTVFEVSGRATFSSVVNTKYPKEYYTAQRFPGLVGRGGNVVIPPISTNAWDIVNLSFSYALDIYGASAGTYEPTDMHFKPDGTKLFISWENLNVTTYNGQVTEHTLSTAWDLSTVSPAYITYAITTYRPNGITMKPDGTKMYVSGTESNGTTDFYEYNLSTAWSLLAGSPSLFQTRAVSPITSMFNTRGIVIRDNGLQFFYNKVDLAPPDYKTTRYLLSTAWDLSTLPISAIPDKQTFLYAFESKGLAIKSDDGTRLWISRNDGTNDLVYQYDLSIAYDVSTAVQANGTSITIGASTASGGPSGLFWKADGTSFYAIRNDLSTNPDTLEIYQYDIV